MKPPVESGIPSANVGAFRRTLGEFATGVTVITTTVDGASFGMTSNSSASVSLDPPLVLWSIRRESQSFAAFERCEHFAVNVLADDQIVLSEHFAKSGPGKFKDIPYSIGRGGAPLLHDTDATLECRRTRAHEGGDHLILVGEVELFSRYDRPPLLFCKGRYAVTAEHPHGSTVAPTIAVSHVDGGAEVLPNLMIRAYLSVAAEVESAGQKAGLGLTLTQARFLRACAAHPGITIEALQPELLLDFNSSQSVMGALVSKGLVEVDSDDRVRLTTACNTRVKELVAHARQCEHELFKNIPANELATPTRALARIVEADQRVRRGVGG
jgi:flavin reductase (DIM6/NTAB) family NADH-FMN oxidoreductase RutF/DNA-binding MarR family transcriptional regulator